MSSVLSDGLCPLCGAAEFATSEAELMASWLNLSCSDCGLLCEVQVGAESPDLSDSLTEWRSLFPDD